MTVWLPVVGYEGRYEVSSAGQIRSLLTHKVLRQSMHSTKRYQVNLTSPGGKAKTRKVHQLVAEAFIGLPPEGMVVCHNNGNGLDNRASNLRYDTQRANIAEAVNHRSQVNAEKKFCSRDHAYTDENTYWYRGRRMCKTCRFLRNNKLI